MNQNKTYRRAFWQNAFMLAVLIAIVTWILTRPVIGQTVEVYTDRQSVTMDGVHQRSVVMPFQIIQQDFSETPADVFARVVDEQFHASVEPKRLSALLFPYDR